MTDTDTTEQSSGGSNVTYVRWCSSESRRARTFDPPTDTHPLVRHRVPCLLCGQPVANARMQLLVMGPDPEHPDPEDGERHAAGRWYSACPVVVHEACLVKLSDPELEELVDELMPRDDERGPVETGHDDD